MIGLWRGPRPTGQTGRLGAPLLLSQPTASNVTGTMTTHHNHRLATRAIHAGEPQPRILGSVTVPIFQSAMFESAGEAGYHDIRYIRLNNTPNHAALHRKLALLEHAEDALVAASGMAAITTTLLAVLTAGDHLLAQDSLYGGTHDFVTRDLQG